MLQKIKERILAGGEITPDEALELAQKAIRSDLYAAADEIRKNSVIKRSILARSSMPVLVIVPKLQMVRPIGPSSHPNRNIRRYTHT